MTATLRSPSIRGFRKATQAADTVLAEDGPEVVALHEIADRRIPQFQSWAATLIAGITAALTPTNVRRLLADSDPETAFDQFIDMRTQELLAPRIRKSFYFPVFKADPEFPLPDLPQIILDTMNESAQLDIGLDVIDPLVVAEARRAAAAQVTGIRRQMRLNIRDAIARGTAGEMSRADVERLIRNSVGMNGQQARAYANLQEAADNAVRYRNINDIADPREREQVRRAQQYRLQGRTKLRPGMTREQADRMLAQYEQKAIRHRAETIARTETMRAANMGRLAGIEQQMRRGLLPGNMQKVWITTEDDRTCPICRPLDGQVVGSLTNFVSTVRGLDLGSLVSGPEITTRTPPIHARCRCSISFQDPGGETPAALRDDLRAAAQAAGVAQAGSLAQYRQWAKLFFTIGPGDEILLSLIPGVAQRLAPDFYARLAQALGDSIIAEALQGLLRVPVIDQLMRILQAFRGPTDSAVNAFLDEAFVLGAQIIDNVVDNVANPAAREAADKLAALLRSPSAEETIEIGEVVARTRPWIDDVGTTVFPDRLSAWQLLTMHGLPDNFDALRNALSDGRFYDILNRGVDRYIEVLVGNDGTLKVIGGLDELIAAFHAGQDVPIRWVGPGFRRVTGELESVPVGSLPTGQVTKELGPGPIPRAIERYVPDPAQTDVVEEIGRNVVNDIDRRTAQDLLDGAKEALQDEARNIADEIQDEIDRVIGPRLPMQPPPQGIPYRTPGTDRIRYVDPTTKAPIPAEWEWWYQLPPRQRRRLQDNNIVQRRRRGQVGRPTGSGPDEVADAIAENVPGVAPGTEMEWFVGRHNELLDQRSVARGRPPRDYRPRTDLEELEDLDLDRVLRGDPITDEEVIALRQREVLIDQRHAENYLPEQGLTDGVPPWQLTEQAWNDEIVDQLQIVDGLTDGNIPLAEARLRELVPGWGRRLLDEGTPQQMAELHSEIVETARRANLLIDVDLTDAEIRELAQLGKRNGGFTFNPGAREMVAEGKAVALREYEGIFLPPQGQWTEDTIAEAISGWVGRPDVRRALQDRRNKVGAWVDTSDPQGRLYLDVSRITDTHAQARELAAANNQLAYFDLDTFTEYARPRRTERIYFRSEDGTVRLLEVPDATPRTTTSLNYIDENGNFPLDPVLADVFGRRPPPLAMGIDNLPPPGTGSLLDDIPELPSLQNAMRDRHPGIALDIRERDDYIVLDRIVVPDTARGDGLGSAVMQDLIDEADLSGRTVFLTPSTDFGGTKTRLKEFYSRFGFVDNTGSRRDLRVSETMVRFPDPNRKLELVRANPRNGTDIKVVDAFDRAEQLGYKLTDDIERQILDGDLLEPATLGMDAFDDKTRRKIIDKVEDRYGVKQTTAARAVQDNMIEVFNRADAVDEAWYATERVRMRKFVDLVNDDIGPYGIRVDSPDRLAAMTSLLSPQLDYTRNKLLADRLMRILARNDEFEVTQRMLDDYLAWQAGKAKRLLNLPEPGIYRPSEINNSFFLATKHPLIGQPGFMRRGAEFTEQAVDAFYAPSPGAYMAGRGAKRASFYRNLAEPFDNTFVTLDTWHYRAMAGNRKINFSIGDQKFRGTVREFETGWKNGQRPLPGEKPNFVIGQKVLKGVPQFDADGVPKPITVSTQTLFQEGPGAKQLGLGSTDGLYPWHRDQTAKAWQRVIRDNPELEDTLTLNGFQARIWEQMRIDAGYERTVIVDVAELPELDFSLLRQVERQTDELPTPSPTRLEARSPEDLDTSYRGVHQAPDADSGAPLHRLTDIYPDDVYGDDAVRFYSHGGQETIRLDRQIDELIKRVRDNPDAEITIYRAVPLDVADTAEINPGDWVSPIRDYVVQHGEGPLLGEYRIIERTVRADELFTDGNSWLEWGWSPRARTVPAEEFPTPLKRFQDDVTAEVAGRGRQAPEIQVIDHEVPGRQLIDGQYQDVIIDDSASWTLRSMQAEPDYAYRRGKAEALRLVQGDSIPLEDLKVEGLEWDLGPAFRPRVERSVPKVSSPLSQIDDHYDLTYSQPRYVYRAVTEEDWQRMLAQGFLDSDGRGNISAVEGMNAGADVKTAMSYIARNETPARVIRIEYRDADGWFLTNVDGYLRTNQRVPLRRVDLVSPPVQRVGKYQELRFMRDAQPFPGPSVDELPLIPNLNADRDRFKYLFGQNTTDNYFQSGELAVTPWRSAGGLKDYAPYDEDLVADILASPDLRQMHLDWIDPRDLKATQPNVVKGHVDYYMTDEYRRTGNTSADSFKPGNQDPVVYIRYNPRTNSNEAMILSGHHRATAALLEGKPLRAVVIRGGYGKPRRPGVPRLEARPLGSDATGTIQRVNNQRSEARVSRMPDWVAEDATRFNERTTADLAKPVPDWHEAPERTDDVFFPEDLFGALSSVNADEIGNALDEIDQFIDPQQGLGSRVRVHHVTSSGAPEPEGTLGYFDPNPHNWGDGWSEIFINPTDNASTVVSTMTHEMGHALDYWGAPTPGSAGTAGMAYSSRQAGFRLSQVADALGLDDNDYTEYWFEVGQSYSVDKWAYKRKTAAGPLTVMSILGRSSLFPNAQIRKGTLRGEATRAWASFFRAHQESTRIRRLVPPGDPSHYFGAYWNMPAEIWARAFDQYTHTRSFMQLLEELKTLDPEKATFFEVDLANALDDETRQTILNLIRERSVYDIVIHGEVQTDELFEEFQTAVDGLLQASSVGYTLEEFMRLGIYDAVEDVLATFGNGTVLRSRTPQEWKKIFGTTAGDGPGDLPRQAWEVGTPAAQTRVLNAFYNLGKQGDYVRRALESLPADVRERFVDMARRISADEGFDWPTSLPSFVSNETIAAGWLAQSPNQGGEIILRALHQELVGGPFDDIGDALEAIVRSGQQDRPSLKVPLAPTSSEEARSAKRRVRAPRVDSSQIETPSGPALLDPDADDVLRSRSVGSDAAPNRMRAIAQGRIVRSEIADDGVEMAVAEPIEEIGKLHGDQQQWSTVRALPEAKRNQIAEQYEMLPLYDPEAQALWDDTGAIIEEQYNQLVDMGIRFEFVDYDPYPSFAELHDDFVANRRVKVLKTSVTGGAAYVDDPATGRRVLAGFDESTNDKFRAVHDTLGHLGTGRGFDRHGEEAAYLAHRSMFPEGLWGVLASELRGQNAFLTTRGDFPEQKLGLMPEQFWKAMMRAVFRKAGLRVEARRRDLHSVSRSENAVRVGGTGHASLGRWQ